MGFKNLKIINPGALKKINLLDARVKQYEKYRKLNKRVYSILFRTIAKDMDSNNKLFRIANYINDFGVITIRDME